MSLRYYAPEDFERMKGTESLGVYQFGDRDVLHYFCRTCGIAPFHQVAAVPPGYAGPARVGDRRVNLGCVEGLDVLALPVDVVDGRSF
jgi:hypothetical protein